MNLFSHTGPIQNEHMLPVFEIAGEAVRERHRARAVVVDVAVYFLPDVKHGLLGERGDVDVLVGGLEWEFVGDIAEQA